MFGHEGGRRPNNQFRTSAICQTNGTVLIILYANISKNKHFFPLKLYAKQIFHLQNFSLKVPILILSIKEVFGELSDTIQRSICQIFYLLLIMSLRSFLIGNDIWQWRRCFCFFLGWAFDTIQCQIRKIF